MRVRSSTSGLLSLALLAGCGLYDVTSGPSNPSWCGDAPCEWSIDEGKVTRAPTWHELDPGLGLEGDPTRISLVPKTSEGFIPCLALLLRSQFDHAAKLTFQIDVGDDGTIELEREIHGTNWELTNIELFVDPLPPGREPVRFTFLKEGPGRVTLADIRLRHGSCPRAPDVRP
jgi:hypothetical protein